MIPGWPWWLLGLLTGIILGTVITSIVVHRWPVLLFPEDWRAAWQLRRQRRRMSDPDDRISS